MKPYVKKNQNLTICDLKNHLISLNNDVNFIFPDKEIINSKIGEVRSLEKCKTFDISFFKESIKFKDYFLNLPKDAICIISNKTLDKYRDFVEKNLIAIVSDNVMLTYCHICDFLYTNNIYSSIENPIIDESAKISNFSSIGNGSRIGKNVIIEDFVKIGQNVIIGENTIIKSNSVIEDGSEIGSNCRIDSCVTIKHAFIGNSCIFFSGVRIGQDGFGYTENFNEMRLVKMKQLGVVKIGNNVEIGANSCVDRGAINDTEIHDNVKIDNLVQIAHNCVVGNSTRICGNSTLAGGVSIGMFNIIGGFSCISNMVKIGNKNMIGGGSSIFQDITDNQTILGTIRYQNTIKESMRVASIVSSLSKIIKELKKNENSW